MPRITVIIPVHNQEQLLRQAVESVLWQTWSDWELIIIDDGSTDGTGAYLRGLHDHRISVIFHERCGSPARLRNAGLAQATGTHIAFLDSDDLWLPEKLAIQLDTLAAAPHSRWSFTHFDRISQNGRAIPNPGVNPPSPCSGWMLRKILEGEVVIALPSVMAEKSLIHEAGSFNESLRFCSDYDLWLRLAMRAQVVVLAAPLTRVRTHRTNYTHERTVEGHAYFRQVLHKLIEELSDEDLRVLARHRCARSLISLAAFHRSAGRTLPALGALRDALRFRPIHKAWFGAVAKTLIRPLIPGTVLSRYNGRGK